VADQKKKYPAMTNRNFLIDELKKVDFKNVHKLKKALVAGRVIGIIDGGFVLQDMSGRVDFLYDGEVNLGDIVEVEVGESFGDVENDLKGCFAPLRAVSVRVLVPCAADFFIRKEDSNYRKMIVDLNLAEKIRMKSRVVECIRNFFRDRSFLEVETPQMVKLPGMEPYLDPFKTTFFDQSGSQTDQYLISSPEYAMKKILVSGEEKIFQICKSFRNKETDSELHNPEFTLLEWYRSYVSYEDIMKDTEELVEYTAVDILDKPTILYKGSIIDVSTPWPRIKVKDLFKRYAKIDSKVFEDPEKFRKAVKQKGYQVDENISYDDLFFCVFMNEIEPKLGFDKPVIVYEYPASMAALSKKCESDPAYAERFEVYIAGVELCNAFTELNDPVEQKSRLEDERRQRLEMGKDDYSVDQSFIGALELGMPPAGGNALGVDRLAMLITDTHDIRDMMFFPFRDL